MNPVPNMPAVEPDDWIDHEFAKDVFYPEDTTGELSMAYRLRSKFEAAGYRIKVVEKPSQYHDVWVIEAIRQSAPHFSNNAEFLGHVIQILRGAEINVPKANVTAQRTRDRIIVNFLSFPALPHLKKAIPT